MNTTIQITVCKLKLNPINPLRTAMPTFIKICLTRAIYTNLVTVISFAKLIKKLYMTSPISIISFQCRAGRGESLNEMWQLEQESSLSQVHLQWWYYNLGSRDLPNHAKVMAKMSYPSILRHIFPHLYMFGLNRTVPPPVVISFTRGGLMG